MWPFRKKPEPPKEPEKPGPLNEDWKVGDLAICIEQAENWILHPGSDVPTQGTSYRVTRLFQDVGYHDPDHIHWFIALKDMNNAYTAFSFRKVRQDEEECTTEFAETIKNLKPARVK